MTGRKNDLGVVSRLNGDGSVDSTFGSSGSMSLDDAYTLPITDMQQDGKILVWGTVNIFGEPLKGFIARLNNDFQINIEEVGNEKSLAIYPNPVNDQLTIQAGSFKGNEAVLEVLDIYGRIVIRQTVNGSTEKSIVEVSELPPGYYVLRLVTKSGCLEGAFIRQD